MRGEAFTVWAPGAERVRVVIGETGHEMARSGGGWWRAEVPGAGAGTDYAFQIGDDDTRLPDPRSAWQPEGVHGPSRRYEHRAFPWTDQRWTGRALPGAVVYELHIGTFTEEGTFNRAIEHLDHLVDLGVDLVEVLPVNAFDGDKGWGYDGVLWGAVHQPYGGPDAFKRFVDACHSRGLGVVLDVVYNHLGPSGAYLGRFGPYFKGETIWGPSLNLDGPGSDEVRRYVIDNALTWFREFHVDALRLDAVHALHDERATHVLEELAAETAVLSASLGRPLSLIAESDLNDPKHTRPRAAGGYGLDAQWCDDVHHALHVALTGETTGYYADFGAQPDFGGLKQALENAFFHAGTWSSFRGRSHGRQVDRALTPGHRFVVCLQNHDQIGNRATGDRLTATISPRRVLCGAALMLCSPFTPMLFMGEEWAATTPWQFFASFPDPELADAVRTGRRREFAEHGWGESEVPDPMDPATVLRSTLRWGELADPDHRAVYDTYKALIALRKAHPSLSDPRLDRFAVEVDSGVVTLHRGPLALVVNLGAEAAPLTGEVVFASPGAGPDSLPPDSFAVVSGRSAGS
jgi:maltooligosyltrehalose trehalohydrolase